MPDTLLATIITLSKIDAALARIFAEKKSTESTLTTKEAELKKLAADKAAKQKVADELKKRYSDEEQAIKDEQVKIADRRKALNTLHNYKLQQAAIREVDYQTRQLKVREDALLKMLEEADVSEKALKAAEQKLSEHSSALDKIRADSAESLVALEKLRNEKAAERNAILPSVLPAILQDYERVKSRYPANAMVPVNNGSCTGCFIQVAAQLMVQIHKAETVVKCRGCGRILYLDASTPESSASQASAK